MHEDDYAPLATPGDAHREWHRNAGVPMGQPGCPQDACHPVEDDDLDLADLDLDPAPAPAPAATSNGATQRQLDLIAKLKTERDLEGGDIRRSLAIGREQWRLGRFGKREASALIDALFAAPKIKIPAERADLPPAPEGMHKIGDEIFKVQLAVHGSGQPYAKKLILVEGEESWSARFEYAPGAAQRLSQDTLMSLDEAREFGVLYGTCCVCGRTLTDEESIARGIGPICAEKF